MRDWHPPAHLAPAVLTPRPLVFPACALLSSGPLSIDGLLSGRTRPVTRLPLAYKTLRRDYAGTRARTRLPEGVRDALVVPEGHGRTPVGADRPAELLVDRLGSDV